MRLLKVVALPVAIGLTFTTLLAQSEDKNNRSAAGEYTLIVFVRDGNNPELKSERQITIPDDKVSEITISLDSKSNRPRTSTPLVPR